MSKNVFACLIAGLGLACGDSPTGPESPTFPPPVSAPAAAPTPPTSTAVPKSAGVQGGNTQAAQVGATLPSVLSVWVVDALGKVLPNVAVTFAVTGGGGRIELAKATTNSAGIASSGKWTLGSQLGQQTVVTTVDGRGITVLFAANGTAIPAAPAPGPTPTPTPVPAPVPVASAIAVASGNSQVSPAGRGIRNDITLRVTDAVGNPFANAVIALTTGNGGSVTPGSITTNSSGVATVRGWTLGPAAGPQTLSARVTTGTTNPTATVNATAVGVRIVTFGDSNTDQGYAGIAPQVIANSYVSVGGARLSASAPNSSTQLAGKIESKWTARYSSAIIAVNHGIGGTSSGSGRSLNGSPNALAVVNGVSRYEGEVLGMGSPWNGGEPVNTLYSGPIVRARAFVPTVNDFVYVSIGTNDGYYGVGAAQTVANITAMIDRWIARGLPADHFIVTTLAPSPVSPPGSMPEVNAGIRALAAQKGVKVIDLAAFVSPDDGLTWRSQSLVIQDTIGAHYVESVRDWLADQVATIMGSVTAPR